MAKPNYSFEKRQRELAKKKKKEEKEAEKRARRAGAATGADSATDEPLDQPDAVDTADEPTADRPDEGTLDHGEPVERQLP